jgi:hypothetical protein
MPHPSELIKEQPNSIDQQLKLCSWGKEAHQQRGQSRRDFLRLMLKTALVAATPGLIYEFIKPQHRVQAARSSEQPTSKTETDRKQNSETDKMLRAGTVILTNEEGGQGRGTLIKLDDGSIGLITLDHVVGDGRVRVEIPGLESFTVGASKFEDKMPNEESSRRLTIPAGFLDQLKFSESDFSLYAPEAYPEGFGVGSYVAMPNIRDWWPEPWHLFQVSSIDKGNRIFSMQPVYFQNDKLNASFHLGNPDIKNAVGLGCEGDSGGALIPVELKVENGLIDMTFSKDNQGRTIIVGMLHGPDKMGPDKDEIEYELKDPNGDTKLCSRRLIANGVNR